MKKLFCSHARLGCRPPLRSTLQELSEIAIQAVVVREHQAVRCTWIGDQSAIEDHPLSACRCYSKRREDIGFAVDEQRRHRESTHVSAYVLKKTRTIDFEHGYEQIAQAKIHDPRARPR